LAVFTVGARALVPGCRHKILLRSGSRGGISLKKKKTSFAFEKTPRISLGCKLIPVQYREYEYGLFWCECLEKKRCVHISTQRESYSGIVFGHRARAPTLNIITKKSKTEMKRLVARGSVLSYIRPLAFVLLLLSAVLHN